MPQWPAALPMNLSAKFANNATIHIYEGGINVQKYAVDGQRRKKLQKKARKNK